jgi:hypothetical protein
MFQCSQRHNDAATTTDAAIGRDREEKILQKIQAGLARVNFAEELKKEKPIPGGKNEKI